MQMWSPRLFEARQQRTRPAIMMTVPGGFQVKAILHLLLTNVTI